MPMRHSPQRSNDRDVADVNGSQRLKEATAPSRRLALFCTLQGWMMGYRSKPMRKTVNHEINSP
jgi:hypothetical protein